MAEFHVFATDNWLTETKRDELLSRINASELSLADKETATATLNTKYDGQFIRGDIVEVVLKNPWWNDRTGTWTRKNLAPRTRIIHVDDLSLKDAMVYRERVVAISGTEDTPVITLLHRSRYNLNWACLTIAQLNELKEWGCTRISRATFDANITDKQAER